MRPTDPPPHQMARAPAAPLPHHSAKWRKQPAQRTNRQAHTSLAAEPARRPGHLTVWFERAEALVAACHQFAKQGRYLTVALARRPHAPLLEHRLLDAVSYTHLPLPPPDLW